MPPSLAIRFLGAVLAILALAGCAHRHAGFSPPAPTGASRDGETLRIARQPLAISHDKRYRHAILEVRDSRDVLVASLYLSARDEILLRAARVSGDVEIRYWEQLKQVFPDGAEIPVGELESVIAGTRVLLDRSFCELHDLKMPRETAQILYGPPAPAFVEAWIKFFPNAAISLGGSVVAEDSPETEIKYVCPDCEETRAQWADTRRGN